VRFGFWREDCSKLTAFAHSICLLVENEGQKGLANLNLAIVFDEAELSELGHKQIHPRPRCTNHLRQYPLRNFMQHSPGSIVPSLREHSLFWAELRNPSRNPSGFGLSSRVESVLGLRFHGRLSEAISVSATSELASLGITGPSVGRPRTFRNWDTRTPCRRVELRVSGEVANETWRHRQFGNIRI
jgi:hypothetical protein